MAIFLTGDIHGDISRLSSKNFPEGNKLTKQDYVIVLGDFGCLWDGGKEDAYKLKWLQSKSFTTLFIDGNHENFELLKSLPEKQWAGGRVGVVNDSVLHLRRGEIYSICGKKIFTFGGAESHDIEDGVIINKNKVGKRIDTVDIITRHLDRNSTSMSTNIGYSIKSEVYNKYKHRAMRVLNKSWWYDEMPSQAEMEYGERNLVRNNGKVDYILTHCGPSILEKAFGYRSNYFTAYLSRIYNGANFKRWYCGHYHTEANFGNINILYRKIERIV